MLSEREKVRLAEFAEEGSAVVEVQPALRSALQRMQRRPGRSVSRVAVDAGKLGMKEAADGGWLCRCRSPQRTRQLSEAHAAVGMGLPSLCGGLCHCTCTGMKK